jgi:hypothetical protein
MNNDAPSWGETFMKMALAAIPYAGGPLEVLYGDIIARRKGRVAEMGTVALSRFDGSVEDFMKRLQDEPRIGNLFVTAAETAERTPVEEKARAMGLLLADAAATEEESALDEKELLVLALADLEWPHIRALARLGEFESDDELRQRGVSESHVRNQHERLGRATRAKGADRPCAVPAEPGARCTGRARSSAGKGELRAIYRRRHSLRSKTPRLSARGSEEVSPSSTKRTRSEMRSKWSEDCFSEWPRLVDDPRAASATGLRHVRGSGDVESEDVCGRRLARPDKPKRLLYRLSDCATCEGSALLRGETRTPLLVGGRSRI